MLRISATTLEAFRLWRDEDWMREEQLLATITKTAPQTREMAVGAAFGAVLADPETYAVSNGLGGVAAYSCDGWDFSADTMRVPLGLYDRRGLPEVKATRDYDGARLVAKADHRVGGRLIETKTTFSTFAADRYERSYQWRVMLDVFLAVSVEYRVFCLHEETNGWITVRGGCDSLMLYPYPRLHDDVRVLLSEFLEYVAFRDVAPWLQETEEARTW